MMEHFHCGFYNSAPLCQHQSAPISHIDLAEQDRLLVSSEMDIGIHLSLRLRGGQILPFIAKMIQ